MLPQGEAVTLFTGTPYAHRHGNPVNGKPVNGKQCHLP
jgi:hypothetical protein